MFDFAALSPETNSTRMYLGPGSSPILTAAAAWVVLAKELTAAAQGLQSAVEALLTTFEGESAAALAERVTPYEKWLTQNAASAELTATQLTVAANAYETAFTMTVPPLMVFVNRAQACLLIMSNIFGQNSTAIAEKEAEYTEMWIQDAAAMTSYQASVLEAVGATKANRRRCWGAGYRWHLWSLAEAAVLAASTLHYACNQELS
ncbi:PPE family protein [Mycobacterium leprae]|uniref:PPE family protein n=2 Tax=Mycobacterium leprae TaxID=1769 RepID=UPI00003D9ED3|nr:PPE family protein [Mycobacterium leprae]